MLEGQPLTSLARLETHSVGGPLHSMGSPGTLISYNPFPACFSRISQQPPTSQTEIVLSTDEGCRLAAPTEHLIPEIPSGRLSTVKWLLQQNVSSLHQGQSFGMPRQSPEWRIEQRALSLCQDLGRALGTSTL